MQAFENVYFARIVSVLTGVNHADLSHSAAARTVVFFLFFAFELVHLFFKRLLYGDNTVAVDF